MKYFLFFLIISHGHARIIPSSVSELNFLVETIQSYPNSEEEMTDIKEDLKSIDRSLQSLSSIERSFLVKTIFYKEVLRRHPDGLKVDLERILPVSKMLITKSDSFKEKFHIWLSKSISQDLKVFLKDKNFPILLDHKKNNTAITEKKVSELYEQIKGIAPWAIFLSSNNEDEIGAFLKTVCHKILDSIKTNLSLFVKLSKNDSSVKTDMKFFNLEGKQSPLKTMEEENTVESIVIPEYKPEVEEQSKEVKVDPKMKMKEKAWRPNDTKPEDYPTKDPNYSAPKKLPTPIEDWTN